MAAMAKATSIREKEAAEFTKESGEMKSNLDAMGKGGGGLEPGPYLLGARFSLADVRLCADVYAPEPSHASCVPCLPEAQGSLRT